MITTASSTGFAWDYGIRSNKKAADRSAAFYIQDSVNANLYYSSFAPRIARLRSFSVR